MSLSAAQKIERAAGLGGSDAAAAVNMSPYKSALELYFEKRGELEPPDLDQIERVHFGNVLEDVVAAEYARRTGQRVARVNNTLRHKQHGWMVANIDRRVVGSRVGLECKTADKWTAHLWGESGSDEVPQHYLLQAAHYMAVGQFDRMDLAVLIGGNEFRIYHIARDRELEEMLIDGERKFWMNNVCAGIPPEPRDLADLDLLYPRSTDTIVAATPEVEVAVASLADLKEQAKQIDKMIADHRTLIEAHMRDASVLTSTDGERKLATWKSTADSTRIDLELLRKERPEVAAEFLKTTPGSRRFMIK